jgi:hypothetical protein
MALDFCFGRLRTILQQISINFVKEERGGNKSIFSLVDDVVIFSHIVAVKVKLHNLI